MPLDFYIFAGAVSAGILLALLSIKTHLDDLSEIHHDLCRIRNVLEQSLVWFLDFTGAKEAKLKELKFSTKTCKQRKYWRDENGKRHWRKTDV